MYRGSRFTPPPQNEVLILQVYIESDASMSVSFGNHGVSVPCKACCSHLLGLCKQVLGVGLLSVVSF